MADNSLVIKINGSAKNFLDEIDKIQKKTKDLEKVLENTAKVSAVAFAGFAAAIALSTQSFVSYEKALVGVGKTTNIEGKKLEDFGKQFQKLSETIPVSTNELLGIAQAAGQLGVSGEKNLLKFTETVAKLGAATDLSGEQAATTLTRILNATGEGIENIDTFGSVIVRLGNNFAATESEIARMANEVARATGVFGVSSAEAAALGVAMKSVGIQAELGGSAVGKTFRTIDAFVRAGGKDLEKLNKITGLTGDQFKKVFEQDTTKGFQLFIEGIGRVVESGGSAAEALEQFGLKGDEINKVLPILAKNSALVGDALAQASDEVKNATALNDEAAKAYATLGAEQDKLTNTVTNLITEIGSELAPTIKSIVVDIRKFIENVRAADTNLISNIATFLKWGAAITGGIAAISAFLLGAVKISAVIGALGAAFLPATIAASGFWVAVTGPIGIAVAGLALVTAGIVALTGAAQEGAAQPKTITDIEKALERLANKKRLLDRPYSAGGDPGAIKAINEQIAKLEELRKKKIETSEDFGTGSLLIRPEAEQGVDLGASAFGLEQEQALPFAPGDDGSEQEIEKTREKEEAKTAIIDDATQKRIDALRQATEERKSILDARNSVETEEEKKLAQRKAEIENEFAEARKIENATERAAALENLRAKHEEEVNSFVQKEELINLAKAEKAEERTLLDEELREAQIENEDLIAEEDRERLAEKLLAEDEIKQAMALQEAERVVRERNQFLADEIEFGETLAKFNEFIRSKEIQGAKEGASQLIKLTNSKNTTLKGIGKAAASTQAAIATGEGAIKAYSSLSGIPIVGPFLGAAAAAAVIAYGVEQQANILGANQGGLVPLGAGSVGRDSVPATLTPGEIVAPDKNFDEVVEGTALARGFTPPEDGTQGAASQTPGFVTVILEPAGDFIDIIQQKIIEAEIQNTGV